MTGQELTLPHFQCWKPYSLTTSSDYQRINDILVARRLAFDRTLAIVLKRQVNQKLPPPSPVNDGDMIIGILRPGEVTVLLERYGNKKLRPCWTEPMKVISVTGTDNQTIVAKSVWHDKLTRQYHRSQVRPIPRDLDKISIQFALRDFCNDFIQRAPRLMRESDLTAAVPLKDRDHVLNSAKRLYQSLIADPTSGTHAETPTTKRLKK